MPNILIVDDEPLILSSLKSLLSRQWNIATASNGNDSFEAARETPPDLIVVDWSLGEAFDGLHLAKSLRGDDTELPVIVMTGFPSDLIRRQVNATPNAWLISKPCAFQDLLQLIHSILEKVENLPHV